jgi:hypothetical protein
MNKLVFAFVLTLCALPAAAQDLCVPNATGVPTQPGPPIWWQSGGGINGQSIDDPRWLGAAGHSFDYGAAATPYALRALAQTATGALANEFYFSHVISIDPNQTVPHELFIGIHRPGTHTAPDPSSYIVQFHVDAGTGTTPITPTFCAAPPCTTGDWYAVWTDFGNTGSCTGAGGATGERFVPISGVASIAWIDQAARYFKLETGATAFTQDRWAVEIQMPQVASTPGTIDTGIEPGATIWYEAAQHTDATGNGLAIVGEWPNVTSANGICIRTNSTPHALFHVDLMGATPAYANMTALTSGAAPTDCDTGLAIRTPDIGTVLNAAVGTNFATAGLDTEVHANGVNTMVGQVENTSTAVITTPLLGRFRLASWGATAGLSAPGAWKDIRGSVGGVCSQGTAPNCTADDIPAGGKTSIHFDWTLGNDPTLGASEFCQYGLVPPSAGGACSAVGACSCTASGSHCDATTDQGIEATSPSGPCVSAYYQHECMEVELSVPNGVAGGANPVNFVSQSSWNNLNFAQLSTDERTAVIDVRGLAKPAGETDQDVYLFVMPRNMPASLPAGTTGLSLITSNALARAKAIAARYPGASPKDEAAINSMRPGLSSNDATEVQQLLQLAHATGSASVVTHTVVATIGPVEAATVVPTLDIYAFYKSSPQVWAPMTSFAVFLSHEGGLSGIHYEIDGATKVAQNIYHLHVPFDHAREIRIRSQATTTGESAEPPGNPKWPCRGGCCSHDQSCGIVADLGNTGPALLVGMVFVRRRKRRSAS